MPDEVSLKEGNTILCNGKQAVVRFVGKTEFGPGDWIGVEFFKHPSGKNDGSVADVRYFGPCKPNYGLFVKADSTSLKAFTSEDEAATKLQAQVRRKQSADHLAHCQVQQAYDAMESQTERGLLRTNANVVRAAAIMTREGQGAPDKLMNFGSTQKLSLPPYDDEAEAGYAAGSGASAVPALRAASLAETPEIVYHPSSAGGPSVTRDSLDQVVAHFKKKPNVYLPAASVKGLIRRGRERFCLDVPTAVCDLTTPAAPGRMVVLGDTHGQLNDVLWVFFEHGEPSPKNVYLFNGDVVDRGSSSTEILMIILLYKLWDTKCIHMNRGNHEDAGMNENYGLKDECLRKWGEADGLEIFNMFNIFFQYLPLYSIIDEKIFVVHGGMWRTPIRQISALRKVDFRRGLPYMPSKGLDYLFFDALWSDPQDARGCGGSSRGENIVTFGPDITKKFLEQNKFRLLVRSHQLPYDCRGYEWWHDKKCLTLFSASNYCGDCGNFGAVLLLAQGEADQLCEYYAPLLEELTNMEAEAQSAIDKVRLQASGVAKQRQFKRNSSKLMLATVVKKVQELVVQKRTELFEFWSIVDKSPPGVFLIPAATWREGCALVLDKDVPWMKVQEAMGIVGNTGEVHYLKFLTRYRVAFEAGSGLSISGWETAVWSRLMETLLRADLPLREALAAIDSTNDGLVSMLEFGRLVESCRAGISAMQARKLLRTLAAHGTEGKVHLWDFLERLQVTLPIAPAGTDESLAWVVKALRPLASAVLDDAATRLIPPGDFITNWPVSRLFCVWFEQADTSGNGYLEHKELVEALIKLRPKLKKNGCPSSNDQLENIASYCDVMKNGRVNYFELLNALTWEDFAGPEMKEDLMDGVHAAIFFNKTPILRSLQCFDAKDEGIVKTEHFAMALQTVFTAITANEAGEELTKEQVDLIAASLPQEHGGGINYVRFLESFRVVDAREELSLPASARAA